MVVGGYNGSSTLNDVELISHEGKNCVKQIRPIQGIVRIHWFCYPYTRTSQDMDGGPYTDFAKFETVWDSLTKVSALLQVREKLILCNFGGYGSKIGPAMPISSWCFQKLFFT